MGLYLIENIMFALNYTPIQTFNFCIIATSLLYYWLMKHDPPGLCKIYMAFLGYCFLNTHVVVELLHIQHDYVFNIN